MDRFDKANADLWELRGLVSALVGDSKNPELARTVPAVDAAFKSEVLEHRIRRACQQQALRELSDTVGPSLNETETGRHFWDFDWWLTEATLRALHAGVDALAQLLNIVFELGKNPDSPALAREVQKALADDDRSKGLADALESFRDSPQLKALGAFVNYVKHAGFPRRGMRQSEGADGVTRSTVIGRFVYKQTTYGPWEPAAVGLLIDDFRSAYMDVLRVAAKLSAEA